MICRHCGEPLITCSDWPHEGCLAYRHTSTGAHVCVTTHVAEPPPTPARPPRRRRRWWRG